jgi:hypothetical protein
MKAGGRCRAASIATELLAQVVSHGQTRATQHDVESTMMRFVRHLDDCHGPPDDDKVKVSCVIWET